MKKATQSQKTELLEGLQKCRTNEDLLLLLNKTKDIMYGEHSRNSLRLKSITYYGDNRISKKKYKVFKIKKKAGGERVIHAPYKSLKFILRVLNYLLQTIYEPHENAVGFVVGKSIVTGASMHVNKKFVYNIDLKDFFPSIRAARVAAVLQLKPFSIDKKVAGYIANMCSTHLDVERVVNGKWETINEFVLPQGAPTSPTLTNIICQRLDRKLTGIAKRFGLTYSRYADDITFSSNHYVYKKDGKFIAEFNRVIQHEGFHIKPSKTRLLRQGNHQEVTGIVVNEKTNISRGYVTKLRSMLYNWESKGYEYAQSILESNYTKTLKKDQNPPSIVNVVRGKLLYMKMVKGEKDLLYQKYYSQYEKLSNNKVAIARQAVASDFFPEIDDAESNNTNSIDDVLDTLVNKGLKEAIKVYERGKNR